VLLYDDARFGQIDPATLHSDESADLEYLPGMTFPRPDLSRRSATTSRTPPGQKVSPPALMAGALWEGAPGCGGTSCRAAPERAMGCARTRRRSAQPVQWLAIAGLRGGVLCDGPTGRQRSVAYERFVSAR